jgi:hypothetical protein
MAHRGEKMRYPRALQKLVKGVLQVFLISAMKMQNPSSKEYCYSTVLSNLVAICHMWRQRVVQKYISNGKYTIFLSNFDNCGDRENMDGHHSYSTT